ncbi:MAG: hypothetical protein RLZZ584_2562 [Pseudomonadota bacterium]
MNTQTTSPGEKRLGGHNYATWGYYLLGLLGLIAAFTVVRPRASIDKGPPTPAETAKLISEAVSDVGKEQGGTDAAEAEFLAAQRKQLAEKKSAEELSAKLDQLARDPKALEQHNRDVANKVQLTVKGDATTAQAAVRGSIESALDDVKQEETAARKEGFVSAIQSEATTRQAEMRTIVVAPGDTLSIIAQRAYGDVQMYRRIFEANPRVLASPNHIYPGQVLRIPAI